MRALNDVDLIRLAALLLSIVVWVALYRLVGLFLGDE
jgi:hypothetical protein